MATKTKRKTTTKRGKTSRARRNPTTALATRKTHVVSSAAGVRRRNPRRRVNNPASMTGLIGAALGAGVGLALFDEVLERAAPNTSGAMQVGIKLGAAYAVQQFGGKVPLLRNYKNELALVLAVLGVTQAFNLWVMPMLTDTVSAWTNPAAVAVMPVQAEGGNMSGYYDQGY